MIKKIGMNRSIGIALVIFVFAVALLYVYYATSSTNKGTLQLITNNSTQSLTVIKYANIQIYDPTYIAYALGYFKQENITIDFVGSTISGPQAIIAVSTGAADAGVSATTSLINAVQAGANVIGVLDLQTAFNSSPLADWFVLNNSNITTPQDIKGKTIGLNSVGASFYYATLVYLSKYGITANDVYFKVMPLSNIEQALRSGQIDIGGIIDPYSTHAMSTGGVRVLFNEYNATGQNQFSLVFFSTNFAKSHPDVVRRFSIAYIKAVNFSYQHPDQAAEIVANYTGVNSTYVRSHLYTPNAMVNMSSIAYWINTLKNYSDTEINVTPGMIGTNQYNPYVSNT